MKALAVLFFFVSVLSCPAMISFGYLTKETAKKRGVELSWKPVGPESVWVELSINTTGELKAFAKPIRGNRIDLVISRGEEKPSLLRTSLKEDRDTSGRLKVSFSVLRSELPSVRLWITQYIAGIAHVVRMEDFIALDKIDPVEKVEPGPKPVEKSEAEAPAAAAGEGGDD